MRKDDDHGLELIVVFAALLLVLFGAYIAVHAEPPKGGDPIASLREELNRPLAEPTRILMFTAAWCGPCQNAKRDIVPKLRAKGWQVDYIDIDTYQQLTKSAGVSVVPTFVVVRGRKEVSRKVGYGMPTEESP